MVLNPTEHFYGVPMIIPMAFTLKQTHELYTYRSLVFLAIVVSLPETLAAAHELQLGPH